MSTSIDQRIVSMKFDNAQFEKAASQSMSTLEKLREKLNFKGAAKGLEDLAVASEAVSLSHLEEEAGQVEVKFNAMAVVAISALQRITNAAITAGSNLVKSLSLDQVTAGFSKYEARTSSVQTLVNSTGKSMEEIEKYLDKLMWFSDETSYGFGEMTQALATMVSSGGDIEKLVPMLEGVANATAFAGKSNAEFQRSIFNLSQSYGAGALTLMDWRSVEQAGVGSRQLKETFIQVGEELGKIKKGEIDIGNFSDSLQKKWADTTVMERAFGRFAEMTEKAYEMVETGVAENASEAYEMLSQSFDNYQLSAAKAAQQAKSFTDAIDATKDAVSTQWMKTFNIIFGNYEEATEMWTGLTNILWDVFASSGEARNEMLQGWKDIGGRMVLLETFSEAWRNLSNILGTVKNAFHDVFPPMTSERLFHLTAVLHEFVYSLSLSDDALQTVKTAVKALLVPVNLLWQVFRVGVTLGANLVKTFVKLADSLLAFPQRLDKVSDGFKKIFGDDRYNRIATAMSTIVQRLGSAFGTLSDHAHIFFSSLKNSPAIGKLSEAFGQLGEIISPIAEWILDKIVEGIEAIANADYSKMVDWAKNGLALVVQGLSNVKDMSVSATQSLSVFFAQFKDMDPVEFITTLIKRFNEFKTSIKTFFKKDLGFKTITDSIKEETGGVRDVIMQLGDAIQSLMQRLTPAKILVFGFGVTMVSVFMNLSKAIAVFTEVANAVKGVFTGLAGILKAVQDRIKGNKYLQLASAILVLAGALAILGMVDPERLKSATMAIIALIGAFTLMMGALTAINKFLGDIEKVGAGMQKVGLAMLALSASVYILVKAIEALNNLNPEGLGVKLLALASVMAGFIGASVLISKFAPDLSKSGVFLLVFAMAIRTVIGSLTLIANTDLSGAVASLGVMVVIMGLLSATALAASNIKFSSTAGILLFIVDILLLTAVLKKLAKEDMGTMLRGLINMLPIFATILALSLAVRAAGKETAKIGGTLLAMTASILLLQFAIEKIGSMDQKVAWQGAAVCTVLLTVFAMILKVAGTVEGKTKSMAKTFIGMAAAILFLGVAINYIGGLNVKNAIQGTIVVSAVLVLFYLLVKAGAEAKGANTAIIAMSVALGLLVTSLMLLTLIDTKELIASAVSLGIVLAAFGVAIKSLQKIKIGKGIVSVLAIGAFLFAIVEAFRLMAELEPDGLIKKSIALGILLETFALASRHLKPRFGDWKNLAKSALFMGGFLAEAVAALAILGQIPDDGGNLIAKATALGIVLGALALSSEQIKVRTGKWENVGKTLVFLGAFLAEAAIALGILGALDIGEGIIQKAIGLGIVLGALALASNAIKMQKSSWTEVGTTLVTMAGALAMATAVISILSILPVDDHLIQKATSLSILLLAMSGAMAIISSVGLNLSMLGSVVRPALKGALAAAGIIVGLIALIEVIGLLFKHIDGLDEGLKKAEDVIPRIGKLMGSFVGEVLGGLIGGVGEGITEVLPAMADNFALFAEKIQPFLALEVKQEVVDSIGRLVEIAGAMTGQSFIEAISFWNGDKSSMEKFGEQLKVFGQYFAEFATAVADIKTAPVYATARAMEAFGSMLAQIPTEGGIINWIFGEKNLETFGSGLKNFAEAFVTYSQALTDDIDDDMVKKTEYVGQALSKLIAAVPLTGGISSIFGDADMVKFGTDLKQFALDMIVFFKRMNNDVIKSETVDKVGYIGDALSKLANSVPLTGALPDFLGKHDIGVFGDQLVQFAGGMGGFFEAMDSVIVDTDLVDKCTQAGKALVELAKTVPNSGALITFFGGKDIGTFGTQIGLFGKGLGEFFSNITVNDINSDKIETGKAAGVAFAELAEKIGPNSGFLSIFSGTDVGVFGQQISAFGSHMATYYSKIADIHWPTVATSITQFGRLAEMAPNIKQFDSAISTKFGLALTQLANSGIKKFTETFSSAEEDISNTVETTIDNALTNASNNITVVGEKFTVVIDALLAGIRAHSEELNVQARELCTMFASTISGERARLEEVGSFFIFSIVAGMDRNEESLQIVVIRVMSNALDKARTALGITGTYSTKFYELGEYSIRGYIKGFEDNSYELYSKLTNLGNRSVQTFADAVGVASPSKKFAEIGMYAILGFNQGIAEHTVEGEKALVKMGEKFLESVQTFFGIRSPSTVMRDEVGRYLVQGIAEGITADTSAEEAASKKAQNIINAFKAEFEKFSLDMETSNLEFELWQAMNPNATDAQTNGAKLGILEKQMTIAAERVNTANAQYQATLKALGENAEETQQAYNTYLQEQIDMADIATSLSEARNANAENFKNFASMMGSMYEDLTTMGFSKEEIENWAKQQSGWTQSSGMTVGTQAIYDEYMNQSSLAGQQAEVVIVESVQRGVTQAAQTGYQGGVSTATQFSQGVSDNSGAITDALSNAVSGNGTIQEKVSSVGQILGGALDDGVGQGILDNLNGNISKAGTSAVDHLNNLYESGWGINSPSKVTMEYGSAIVEGLAVGMMENMRYPLEAANQTVDQVNYILDEQPPYWQNIGAEMCAGMTAGIQAGAPAVIEAAQAVAQQALAAAMAALGVHSPSREFYKIGQMIDQGLANGITDDYGIVDGSISKIVERMQEPDLTIRPVVDMDDAYEEVREWYDELEGNILVFDASGNLIPSGYYGRRVATEGRAGYRWALVGDETYDYIREMTSGGNWSPDHNMPDGMAKAILKSLYQVGETGALTEESYGRADTYNYNVTQNISSPTPADPAEISRRTYNEMNRLKQTSDSTIHSTDWSDIPAGILNY